MPTPAVSGKYEVPQDSFDDRAADENACVHRIDLKELLPDLFVGTDRMPRLLGQVWRDAADAALEDAKGAYTYRGGNAVEILFSGEPEGAGRARVAALCRDIVAQFAAQAAPQEAPEIAKPPQDTPLYARDRAVETAFVRVMRDGIGVNPDDDTVRLWCARVMHELLYSHHRIPLLPEMMKLVGQAGVTYAPLLDCESGIITGSVCQPDSAVAPGSYAAGEILRQDLAMLFSATVLLYYMQARAQEGLIVVPLRVYTLGDAAIADLYRVFLPRIARGVGESVILEIQGLPSGGAWPSLVETILELSNAVRSFILETAAQARIDPLKDFPTLHAAGFSLQAAGVAPKEARKKAAQFAEYYRKQGLKTYVRDVASPGDVGWLRDCGFTYISGPAVGALQKNAWPLQKKG